MFFLLSDMIRIQVTASAGSRARINELWLACDADCITCYGECVAAIPLFFLHVLDNQVNTRDSVPNLVRKLVGRQGRL